MTRFVPFVSFVDNSTTVPPLDFGMPDRMRVAAIRADPFIRAIRVLRSPVFSGWGQGSSPGALRQAQDRRDRDRDGDPFDRLRAGGMGMGMGIGRGSGDKLRVDGFIVGGR